MTYKILVLDLLTKRLSPSIISGIIINNAHKAGTKSKSGESFIAEIIRKGNADAFIKGFTDKPHSVGKGSGFGVQGVEQLMKALQMSNLILVPRIKKSVKDSLDGVQGIRVFENAIKFNRKMEEMHSLLIEIL